MDGKDQLAEGDARGSGGVSRPPGPPVRHNPGGPPGDSGDDGGGGDGPEESDEGTPVTGDHLTSLLEIPIQMVIMIEMHDFISL